MFETNGNELVSSLAADYQPLRPTLLVSDRLLELFETDPENPLNQKHNETSKLPASWMVSFR